MNRLSRLRSVGSIRFKASRWWLLLAVPVLFVVVSDLFGWRYLRLPLQNLLQRTLERPVTIGEPFRVHLRATIHARVGQLTIAAPGWSGQTHFVDLGPVSTKIGWGILLGRRPHLHDLDLERADLRVERRADGKASWQFGAERKRDDTSRMAIPRVDSLRLGEVRVAFDDRVNDVKANARAATTAGEAGAQDLDASGDGSWHGHPLGFRLQVPHVLQLAQSTAASTIRLQARIKSTQVKFDGAIGDVAAVDGIDGTLTMAGNSLGDLALVPGLTLPETPPFRIEGKVRKDGLRYTIGVSRFDLGASRLTADLHYDGQTRPPSLKGRLNATRFMLQDLGPSIGQEASAKNRRDATSKGKERVIPDREFDLPALRQMQADVLVDLNQLDLGTDALRPLRSVKAQLSLNEGVLRLSDLQASLAGGTVTGSTSFDGSRDGAAPVWKSRLRWRQVDLRDWVRNQGSKLFIAGRFNGDTDFTGAGNSTAKILQSLGGTIKGRVDGGSISHLIIEAMGLDVAQALGVFVSGPKPLPLSCALLDLSASKGKLRSNLVLLNTPDSIVFVRGDADLRAEALNLELVSAPKDWSPLSLRSPIAVTGSFSQPSVRIQAKPIAAKVLLGALLSAVSPIAAILPFMDTADGDRGEGCTAAIQYVRENGAGR